uniref:Uncharacterized protein n=1 Tax=Steinernema glaseri TaxID=37863 RepID=A0A1I7Y3J1_9BILA
MVISAAANKWPSDGKSEGVDRAARDAMTAREEVDRYDNLRALTSPFAKSAVREEAEEVPAGGAGEEVGAGGAGPRRKEVI